MHISLLGMEQHRKRSLSLSSASSAEQPEAFKSSRNDALPLQTYTCSLPPTCSGHKETTFPSCAALEAHHASHHAHLCDECDKIFPDERFLNLHLAECHDPLVAVRAERGEKTFACFEIVCKRKFSTPRTRRLHLVDYHKYPKTYYFSLPAKGLNDLYKKYGEAVSLLRPDWHARSNASTYASSKSPPSNTSSPPLPPSELNTLPVKDKGKNTGKESDTKEGGMDIDDLVDRFAKSRMLVPQQIRFGKRGGKR